MSSRKERDRDWRELLSARSPRARPRWRDKLSEFFSVSRPTKRFRFDFSHARRWHIKRVSAFLLLVIIGGVATHTLHSMQFRRYAAALLVHVDRCESEGDLIAADRYLGQYVRLVPADTDALARLALGRPSVSATVQKRASTVVLLERVLSRDPNREEVRRALVRMLIELGRYAEAVVHVTELLKTSPQDAEACRWLGLADIGRGNYEAAATALRKSITLDPSNVANSVDLAKLLRDRLERPAEADEVMDELVALLPESARAYSTRARYRLDYQSRESGIADLEKALELAPEDIESLQLAADVAMEESDFVRARGYLERAMSLAPTEVSLYLTLCKLEIAQNNSAAAIEAVREGVRKVGDDQLLLWTLADLLIYDHQWDEAQRLVERLEWGGVQAGLLDYLKAGLHRERGDFLRAARMYERAVGQIHERPDVQIQVEYALADCYHMMGQPDQAIMQYRRVIRTRPRWAECRWNLAAELAMTGRFEESLASCEWARTLAPPGPAQWALYLRLLTWKQRLRPVAEQSWQLCEQIRQRAIETWPESPELITAISYLLRAQGKDDEALAWLNESVARVPKVVELRLVLSESYEKLGRAEDASATLAAAERDCGDSIALRVGKAGRLEANQESEESLRELRDGLGAFPRHDQINLLRGLSLAAWRLRHFELAQKYIEELAALADYDLGSRLLLFDLALREKDDGALRRWVDQIRAIEGPQGVLWRYGEASRLMVAAEGGNASTLQRAWELLEEARSQRPSWGRVYLNIGRLEELRNSPDRAIDAYQSAVELGEHRPDVVSRLVWLLAAKGRYLDADRTVRGLEEDAPVPIEMHRLAAEVFARSQDFAAAVAQARRYVSVQSADYRSHVWLGQMLRIVGRSDEAEAALRESVRIAPKEIGAWVPLVSFLVRKGKTEEAREVMEKAGASLDADMRDAGLAICAEAIGDLDQAEAHHKKATVIRSDDSAVLQAAADFYVRRVNWAEAEAYLRRAFEVEPSSIAVRRGLAVVLAARGDYPSWQEALKLIDANLSEGARSAEDTRVKGILLAMRGDVNQKKSAIKLLEELVSQSVATATERHVLAQLYYRNGESPKAREHMLTLLAQFPDNRGFLGTYIKALLDRGDAREAKVWLNRLESLDPASTQTVALKVRLLAIQENPVEAAELLKSRAEQVLSSDDEDKSLLVDVARLYERIGESDAAGEVYRSFHSMRAEGALPLIAWLSDQGRFEEAFQVCEEAWEKLPAEIVAIPAALLLRTSQVAEHDVHQVESRISAALRQQPNSLALRLALALVRDAQARYSDAALLYKEVLQIDPDNLLALNNIAWLLAQCLGNANGGLSHIEKAISRHGPIPDLLDTRGVILVGLGRLPQAIRDLEEAHANAPQPLIAFHLAQAYLKAGKIDQSRQMFRSITDPDALLPQLHATERAGFQQFAAAIQKARK